VACCAYAEVFKIVMPVERSAGIILFRNTPEGRRYLVLRSARHESQISETKTIREFWDFPKGVLEKGETGIAAAKREAKEETGIDAFELIPDFKETVQYFTRRDGKPIPKFVAIFLACTGIDTVTLSWEHDRFDWLTFKEAYGRVSLLPMKKALTAAENFLKAHDD